MKWFIVLAVILSFAVLLTGLFGCGSKTTVTFPDPNLEAAIREAVDKPEGPIYTFDLESLTMLEVPERDILDLTGLEYCLNLHVLGLWDNNISDISALAGLTNLQELWFGGNNISDISPLARFINLELLDLGGNNISDISPLAGLTDLRGLGLLHNNISDISALVENSGLSEGDNVSLQDNPLSATSIDVYIPQLEERGVFVEY